MPIFGWILSFCLLSALGMLFFFLYQREKRRFEEKVMLILNARIELGEKRSEIEALDRRIGMILSQQIVEKLDSGNVEGTWGDSSSAGKRYDDRCVELIRQHRERMEYLKSEVVYLERFAG